MSYEDGMAALRMEMPGLIPRTEYSVDRHWALIDAVTGIKVSSYSPKEEQSRASASMVKAWDYGFYWNTLTYNQIFGDKRTDMGHAKYEEGGVDFSDNRTVLFNDPEDVFDFDMFEEFGVRDKVTLTAEYNEHYNNMCLQYDSCVNMTGIYVTCMSGLIELMGWDTLLMAAGLDPGAFGDFVNRYCEWIRQYFNALAQSETPVVMIHDDITWGNGAFLDPAFYRKFIFPNYKKFFAPLKDSGKIVLFTSDGNFTEFIDDIAACGVSGFVLEPLTDMEYTAEKYGRSHCIVGNADTRILLSGTKDDIRAEVKRCMDIGRKCPGFFMAVGNHIPANTPVDNALYYNDCFEEMRRR